MKPSAVFFIAVDLLRSLGKRFPSSASFSPASGMWAATYTNPATDGSVSGCFVPTLYDFLCECRVQVHRCADHMGSDFDLAPLKNFEEPRQTLFVAVVVPFASRQIWTLQIEYNLLLQSYGNGMVQSKSDRFAPSPALRLKNLRVPA